MGIDKGKGKGKATRTAAQKQYTNDSLSIAKNYRIMQTSKNPKESDRAENKLNEINERSPKGRIASMGPAGKAFSDMLTDIDIVKQKKGGPVKYKKGGIVGGKTSKSPAQKKFSSSASLKKKK